MNRSHFSLSSTRFGPCAAMLALVAGTLSSCSSSTPSAADAPSTSAEQAAASSANAKSPVTKSGSSAGASKSKGSGESGALGGAAENLQSLYETLGQQQAAIDGSASAGGSSASRAGSSTTKSAKDVQGPATGAVAIDAQASTFQAPARPPEPRKVETVIVDRPMNRAELAFKLADRIRSESTWSPVRQSVALLGLEMIEPGVGGPQYDDLSRHLSGEQSRATTELRRVLGEIATSENLASDPAQLSGVLGNASKQLAPASTPTGLELGTVALCTRVESFGRFVPYAANRFVAGRTIPIIVYSEVENFAQSEDSAPNEVGTPAGGDSASGARWSVQVSQELALYLDSDGSRQWRQPEQTVKDVSRSKRKDYYLVQRIDLPANLSVGRYNLKVTVRDRASGASRGGGSGGEVERTIPIEIVADPRSRD